MRGGGRKPWKQKGTGRARAGTIRSPIWRGGGVTFAKEYAKRANKKINKKMYRAAMRSIWSRLAKEGRLLALEDLQIESPPKSSQIKTILSDLDICKINDIKAPAEHDIISLILFIFTIFVSNKYLNTPTYAKNFVPQADNINVSIDSINIIIIFNLTA